MFLTLPNVRVFIVYDMRNNGDVKKSHGMTEVVYEKGKIVHKGLKVTLSELRQMGPEGLQEGLPGKRLFHYEQRERANSATSGNMFLRWPNRVRTWAASLASTAAFPSKNHSEATLPASHFDANKYDETLNRPNQGTTVFSPFWQADKNKLQRMAPLDYMGRYMKGFFDYAIADELHQLAGDTAQGNGLAVLNRVSKRIVGLTGTMTGGLCR